MAMNGDPMLLRLCLDRLCPPRRDRHVAFPLRRMKTAADAPKAGAQIAAAVASGELTPSEAEHLSGFMVNYVKALDAAEFERRLRAAEAEVRSIRA